MEPVPYEIKDEDVDEVLNAYGDDWSDAQREDARTHVMRNLTDLDLAIARHVSVAPELRVHWILSDEEGEGVTLGLGSIVWRPAVALRMHF